MGRWPGEVGGVVWRWVWLECTGPGAARGWVKFGGVCLCLCMCWGGVPSHSLLREVPSSRFYFYWSGLSYSFTSDSESEVAQSCPSLCDPVDCSLPGSSVHGILQAKIQQWVAISFSRGSSRPRDQTRTWISRIGGRCFNLWAPRDNS